MRQRTLARIQLDQSKEDDVRISFTRNFRANHLGRNFRLGAEAQFIHHAVQTRRQRFVLQFQHPRPQFRLVHPFFQSINIGPLAINSTKEFILLLVDVRIPCTVAIRHGLGIRLDLSQVLFHLVLLSFQAIPLRSNHRSVQFNRNKGWRLTLVLSPASRPQSLPTSMAEYLIDQVDPL